MGDCLPFGLRMRTPLQRVVGTRRTIWNPYGHTLEQILTRVRSPPATEAERSFGSLFGFLSEVSDLALTGLQGTCPTIPFLLQLLSRT
jgi:hypothetical protein